MSGDIKLAIVYDKVLTWGGAERLLLLMNQIWPEAPLYSAIYDPDKSDWAKSFKTLKTSRLSAKYLKKKYQILTPVFSYGFEGFDFSKFDMVISVTSYSAKSIITKPGTCHICYCLTPDRYLWFEKTPPYDQSKFMGKMAELARKVLRPLLQIEDQYASTRPDYYLTLSKKVAKRIKRYYQRDSEIIYPGIDTNFFNIDEKAIKSHFLLVGRMTGYKQMDSVIKAFTNLEDKLVVVGEGSQSEYLKSIAPNNVEFVGRVSDEKLKKLYQQATGVISIQEEDFGLVPLEALACGTPVIVYENSGVSEILNKNCGMIVNQREIENLEEVIRNFKGRMNNSEKCRIVATKYSNKKFMEKFKQKVETIYENYFDKLNS